MSQINNIIPIDLTHLKIIKSIYNKNNNVNYIIYNNIIDNNDNIDNIVDNIIENNIINNNTIIENNNVIIENNNDTNNNVYYHDNVNEEIINYISLSEEKLIFKKKLIKNINKLYFRCYYNKFSYDINDDCCICLNKLNNLDEHNNYPCKTNCNHLFHFKCLDVLEK
jgi:hypothetical protein